MKNIFLMFSVALALLLVPTLSQATEMVIDGTGDIAVISGEVVVVDDGLSEAATADIASNAADATINEGDSTIVVPGIEEPGIEVPGSEETDSEEASSEDSGSEDASSDVGDPTDIGEEVEDPIGDDPIDANVPLPSTVVLLGSGLLALSGLAWRRNNKR